ARTNQSTGKAIAIHALNTCAGFSKASSFPHQLAVGRRAAVSVPGFWVAAARALYGHPETFWQTVYPGSSYAQRGSAVLLFEDRKNLSGFGRAPLSCRLSSRLYRECGVRSPERGHRSRLAAEWLRGGHSGRSK